MLDLRTPGVYVEEVSTFPASVVRVATAVPVFIGYTELAGPSPGTPIKVKSLVEYEGLFGGEPTTDGRGITVHLDANNGIASVDLSLTFLMYQCLRHFYANGGGDAYICSVGTYGGDLSPARKTALMGPLSLTTGSLLKVDEPTLILVPDAYALDTVAELGEVQVAMLALCNKMQDRFSILDVKTTGNEEDDATDFRNAIGTSYLKYGAAYYPQLQTTISPNGPIGLNSFVLKNSNGVVTSLDVVANAVGDTALIGLGDLTADQGRLNAPVAVYSGSKTWTQLLADWNLTYIAAAPSGMLLADEETLIGDLIEVLGSMVAFLYSYRGTDYFENDDLEAAKKEWLRQGNNSSTSLKTTFLSLFALQDVFAAADIGGNNPSAPIATILPAHFGPGSFNYHSSYSAPVGPNPYDAADPETSVNGVLGQFLGIFNNLKGIYDDLKAISNSELTEIGDLFQVSKVLSSVTAAIRNTGYTLPPSGAIAGVYASVDAARGVWKAPANVSLNAVTAVNKMLDGELADLNVHSTGKSINAIRAFRGQGILVYGARTLAGNDNEWRYVPVRRLFIMVEESIKKASEPFVFEPNDARLWQSLKGMVENFLTGIWRDGGLAGAVPKDAFYVKVGLGQTMTPQDILEGKLIIEVGMAAVRPAEFVVLKFSHKMQES